MVQCGKNTISEYDENIPSDLTAEQIQKQIQETRKAMETVAKDLDFVEAARLRDQMKSFQDHLKNKM